MSYRTIATRTTRTATLIRPPPTKPATPFPAPLNPHVNPYALLGISSLPPPPLLLRRTTPISTIATFAGIGGSVVLIVLLTLTVWLSTRRRNAAKTRQRESLGNSIRSNVTISSPKPWIQDAHPGFFASPHPMPQTSSQAHLLPMRTHTPPFEQNRARDKGPQYLNLQPLSIFPTLPAPARTTTAPLTPPKPQSFAMALIPPTPHRNHRPPPLARRSLSPSVEPAGSKAVVQFPPLAAIGQPRTRARAPARRDGLETLGARLDAVGRYTPPRGDGAGEWGGRESRARAGTDPSESGRSRSRSMARVGSLHAHFTPTDGDAAGGCFGDVEGGREGYLGLPPALKKTGSRREAGTGMGVDMGKEYSDVISLHPNLRPETYVQGHGEGEGGGPSSGLGPMDGRLGRRDTRRYAVNPLGGSEGDRIGVEEDAGSSGDDAGAPFGSDHTHTTDTSEASNGVPMNERLARKYRERGSTWERYRELLASEGSSSGLGLGAATEAEAEAAKNDRYGKKGYMTGRDRLAVPTLQVKKKKKKRISGGFF